MSIGWALLASLALLVGNAFFVAAEFALISAKRHRLEQLAIVHTTWINRFGPDSQLATSVGVLVASLETRWA